MLYFFFFFNDTATTEIYTLSLHDALPIFSAIGVPPSSRVETASYVRTLAKLGQNRHRSEEHTSELQSRLHLVCRLLLEKKKKTNTPALVLRAHTTLTCSYTRLARSS